MILLHLLPTFGYTAAGRRLSLSRQSSAKISTFMSRSLGRTGPSPNRCGRPECRSIFSGQVADLILPRYGLYGVSSAIYGRQLCIRGGCQPCGPQGCFAVEFVTSFTSSPANFAAARA